MKTGLFGGTFNPIHLAHLRIAEEMRESCSLDRVVFIPAADPPHKRVTGEVPFALRAAMVERAVSDNPAFTVSDVEARRQGKSYSVHTLEIMRDEHPDDEFYFLIGMDSFRDIPSWKDYARIFELAHIVVAARPGISREEAGDFLPVAMRNDFCYDCSSKNLRHRSGNRVIFLEETCLDISSTRIRELIAEGRSIRYLVPSAVDEYIRLRGLYLGSERK